MKRILPAGLAWLALGAMALPAADFWQKKKFPEWTEKEAQKMIRDSPWAKPVEVHAGNGEGALPSGGGGRGRRGGGGGGGGFDASGGSMGSTGGGDRSSSESDRMAQTAPAIVVTVRCHSALPVKQAVARLRYGADAGTSPEAAKVLSRPETHFIFGVADLPRQLLRGELSGDQLKQSATLRVKGKPPIAAEIVQPDMAQGRLNLYVFFPRKDNVILVEDGEVEFQLKLPSQTIKRTFKLKEMVFEGKLEI